MHKIRQSVIIIDFARVKDTYAFSVIFKILYYNIINNNY